MTWNAALETGGVLVSQKVVIDIVAQPVRQAGPARVVVRLLCPEKGTRV
jgi:hypothetical protein